ncbi:MAG: hypothetical protein K6E10_05715 [Eubacterium sp.]|nr:hypothetical protein [Eubacterium sp.]
MSGGVKDFVYARFVTIFKYVRKAFVAGNSISGSGERVALVVYALKNPDTWILGEGFSHAGLYQAKIHGFKHFGQSSLGAFLILGGVWYTIVITGLYTKIFINLIGGKIKSVISIGAILVFAFLMIYTQTFTRTNIMTALVLIMLAFGMRQRQFYGVKYQENIHEKD